jgi:hypothetical protein
MLTNNVHDQSKPCRGMFANLSAFQGAFDESYLSSECKFLYHQTFNIHLRSMVLRTCQRLSDTKLSELTRG